MVMRNVLMRLGFAGHVSSYDAFGDSGSGIAPSVWPVHIQGSMAFRSGAAYYAGQLEVRCPERNDEPAIELTVFLRLLPLCDRR